MSLHEYRGDLLTADVDIIAHQCNVLSRGVSGLAAVIFRMWPQTNTYHENPSPEKYTTMELFEVEGAPFKYVANCYTQFAPGPPQRHPNLDDATRRIWALDIALNDLHNFMWGNDITKVGFPKLYGCGLAGGYWEVYYERLRRFSERPLRGNRQEIEVHIVEKS